MSLRKRLLLAIAGALFVSFLAAACLSAWQAAWLVRVELSAALATGARTVAGTVQDTGGAPGQPALLRLVASFDGSRHVLAELRQAQHVVAQSRPAPAAQSPAWFMRLASPGLPPQEFHLGGDTYLRLSPMAASEIGERWAEARRLILLLGFFSIVSAAACLLTVAIGLRPLGVLTSAFARLEQGQEGSAVAETGPAEITILSASFNRMQRALRAASHENRRLSAQLDRLAEEERAELARDLHDEVGPLLFALTAWATAARLQAEAGDHASARASLDALAAASADLQQAVRDLLRRLRDSAPTSTDLAASINELLAFWRDIRPQTEFSLNIPQEVETAPEAAKAALFRVAQESISNAIRHGAPSHVLVAIARDADGVVMTVDDNGAGGALGQGFGLAGMEERLKALGGTLEIRRDRGWQITAWTPIDQGVAL